MNIKLELLQNYIYDFIRDILDKYDFDADVIAETEAVAVLQQIKDIVCNDKLSDSAALKEIVCALRENNIDCGSRNQIYKNLQNS